MKYKEPLKDVVSSRNCSSKHVFQRFHKFNGFVLKGTGRGGAFGYPTINLKYDRKPSFNYGVYVARVTIFCGVFHGALHFGPRETFGEKDSSLEVHLLDFDGDLYGEEVSVEMYAKIRDVRAFKDAKALKKRIAEDILTVRRYFAGMVSQN